MESNNVLDVENYIMNRQQAQLMGDERNMESFMFENNSTPEQDLVVGDEVPDMNGSPSSIPSNGYAAYNNSYYRTWPPTFAYFRRENAATNPNSKQETKHSSLRMKTPQNGNTSNNKAQTTTSNTNTKGFYILDPRLGKKRRCDPWFAMHKKVLDEKGPASPPTNGQQSPPNQNAALLKKKRKKNEIKKEQLRLQQLQGQQTCSQLPIGNQQMVQYEYDLEPMEELTELPELTEEELQMLESGMPIITEIESNEEEDDDEEGSKDDMDNTGTGGMECMSTSTDSLTTLTPQDPKINDWVMGVFN